MLLSFRKTRSFFNQIFFLSHPYLKVPFLISFLVTLFISLILLVFYFSLQPQVPLFYSLAQPADYLVAKPWLLIFPLISLFITFVHFFAIQLLEMYDRAVQELFAWGTIAIQIIFLIAFVRIILVIV